MDTPYQLDILIINFNGKALLRELLRSIKPAAEGLKVRTIVFDNSSSDGSAELIANEFPWVVLEKSDRNIGFARGNNRAAELAARLCSQAEILLLLNNDTVLLPDALGKLLDFFLHNPQAVAAAPQLIGNDGKPQRTARNIPDMGAILHSIQFLRWTRFFAKAHNRYRSPDLHGDPAPAAHVAAAALAIRRGAFDRIGGFDGEFQFGVEDLDLCKRLGQLGPVYYLPSISVHHLGRVSSRANRAFVYRGYECGWARYIGKHHGTTAALLYKLLVTLDMPVRLATLGMQWIGQRLTGRNQKASRTQSVLLAAARFTISGLPAFWRA